MSTIKRKKRAEVEIRTPSYKSIVLNDAEFGTSSFQSRTFDTSLADRVTAVVSDKCKILFYDRRMMSFSEVDHPTKTVDISSLKGDSSHILKLVYSPSGNKLSITTTYSLENIRYAPAYDTKVKSFREFTFKSQFRFLEKSF